MASQPTSASGRPGPPPGHPSRGGASSALRAPAALGLLVSLAALAEPVLADRIEVKLAGIDPREQGQVVIFLVDAGGRKMLPISVSPDQAESIYRGRAGVRPPRPLTHELMVSVLEALGAKLARVDITALRENTFFADLSLEVGGRTVSVDARPSDAIALALRVKAPIYAEADLLVPFERSPKPSVEAHPLLSGLGLHLQDLTDELARFFSVPGGRGVLVAEAAPGGSAARSGVERGDVIQGIGGERVSTVTEALAALRAARDRGKPVEIRVVRDAHERKVRLEW